MTTISKKTFACLLALVLTAVAQAQLYIATSTQGTQVGVVTWFTFDINPSTDQVTVYIDNTHLGASGQYGTLTSFGFNVPDSPIDFQQGYSLVSATKTLMISGSSQITIGTGDNKKWDGVGSTGYNLTNFVQDVGAGLSGDAQGGNPNFGIDYGEKATFVFQFSPGFGTSDVANFLGNNGVSAKWQSVVPGGQSTEGFGNEAPVPEPSTYGIAGAGVLMLGILVRRRSAKAAAV